MNRSVRTLLVATLLLLAPAAPSVSAEAAAVAPLTFNGTTFHHRWSQGGQHEFTPAGQEDLAAWTEMVTIWLYPTVTDGEGLAAQANAVLGAYEGSGGQILSTNSLPRTPAKEAEHFIAALLTGRPDGVPVAEFAAARLLLVDGRGVAVVYSRRAYGDDAVQRLGPWISASGARAEATVMAFDPAPAVSSLSSRD